MSDPQPPPTSPEPGASDRARLLTLVDALGARASTLRRDECGDWRITGKLGWIYAASALDAPDRPGFQIYCRCAPEFAEPTSSQAWTWAKKALAFCRVTQDGDMEGMLFLERLPTPTEAEIVRDKLGIPKKRDVSDEERARLSEIGKSTRLGRRDGVANESSN